MSIISTIYFSSKDVKLLSDLKHEGILVADVSSRGINHPALLDVELDFILPEKFLRYKEKYLYDGKESGLIKLTEKFVLDCVELTQEDILRANQKINDFYKNSSKKVKFGVDNVSRGVRLLMGLLFGLAFIFYIYSNKILISAVLILVTFIIFFISFKKQKRKREKNIESNEIDLVPRLKELVKVCKDAKSKNLSAYYYWSL